MAVLLIQDVNSAILSHLSLANDIMKNCTNGLPCLIMLLLSSPRLICRALFGQAALGTRRLLSLLSGFGAGIRINLGYLWQSCIALRHSLRGLVGKLGDSSLCLGWALCPCASLWGVGFSGPPSPEEYYPPKSPCVHPSDPPSLCREQTSSPGDPAWPDGWFWLLRLQNWGSGSWGSKPAMLPVRSGQPQDQFTLWLDTKDGGTLQLRKQKIPLL